MCNEGRRLPHIPIAIKEEFDHNEALLHCNTAVEGREGYMCIIEALYSWNNAG